MHTNFDIETKLFCLFLSYCIETWHGKMATDACDQICSSFFSRDVTHLDIITRETTIKIKNAVLGGGAVLEELKRAMDGLLKINISTFEFCRICDSSVARS